ncbi:MAG: hypothetical protein WCG01_04645 [bacterium]
MKKLLGFLAVMTLVLSTSPVFAEEASTTPGQSPVASTTDALPVVTSINPEWVRLSDDKKALESRLQAASKELKEAKEALKKQRQVIQQTKASSTQTVKAATAEYRKKYEAAVKVRNASIKSAEQERLLASKVLKTSYNASSSQIITKRTATVNEAWKNYQANSAKATSTTSLKRERSATYNQAHLTAQAERKTLNATQAAEWKSINDKFNTAIKAAQDKFKTDTATLKAELEAKKKAILG